MGLDEYEQRFAERLMRLGVAPRDSLDAAELCDVVERPGKPWNPEADAENWLERQWQAEMEKHHG